MHLKAEIFNRRNGERYEYRVEIHDDTMYIMSGDIISYIGIKLDRAEMTSGRIILDPSLEGIIYKDNKHDPLYRMYKSNTIFENQVFVAQKTNDLADVYCIISVPPASKKYYGLSGGKHKSRRYKRKSKRTRKNRRRN